MLSTCRPLTRAYHMPARKPANPRSHLDLDEEVLDSLGVLMVRAEFLGKGSVKITIEGSRVLAQPGCGRRSGQVGW